MDRIIKVFVTGKEQGKLIQQYPLIEKYEGFVLVRVPESQTALLQRRYLTEDITDQYSVKVAGKEIGGAGKKLGPPRHRPGKHHYLVQFAGPIRPVWLKKLKSAGGEPRAPYQNFTYVVRLTPQGIDSVSKLPFVRWIHDFPYAARIATAFRDRGKAIAGTTVLPRTRVLGGAYTVEFFGSDDLEKARRIMRQMKILVIGEDPKGKVLAVEISGAEAHQRKAVDAISRIHGVRSIRERAIKRTSNDVAAGIMGTEVSMGGNGLNLSGKGETIGICDTGLDNGDPSTIHPDFKSRVAYIKSYPITSDFSRYINNPGGNDGPADLESGHGTHVAGSVLGDGNVSMALAGQANPIRGLSYNAKLVFQAVEQELKWKDPAYLDQYGRYLLAGIPLDLKKLFADARKKGVRIHSNSWGGGDPGAYDTQCEQLDQFVWENKDFCIVVAAGNDGTDQDGDGKINPMSVSSPGTAKNCITVGACENKRTIFNLETYGSWWEQDYPVPPYKDDPMADNPAEVAAFSSRGPTLDQRIKPDVVAPGTFVLSTRSRMIAPNNMAWSAFPSSKLYFFMGGTSMGTPLTAGAVGIVREYLRTVKKIKNPSAALLKACIISGAQRIQGGAAATFDNDQGFGRVNLDAVLAPPKPAAAKFQDIHPGLATGGVATFTLNVRSDKSPLRVVLVYTDYPGRSLVNNLNLIVRGPTGKVYAGNNGPDNVNNMEMFHIKKPAPGVWEIQVVGSNVPQGPQDFAIVSIADMVS